MSHRRSEARDAYREKRGKPDWLDREEWKLIKKEFKDEPQKWKQQLDAAKARLEAGSSSHLGSGGWASFNEDFVSIL